MVPKLDDAPAVDNLSAPAGNSNTNGHLNFPVRLFQAEADEVFPLASGQKVAERLRAAGTSVEMITLPELPHRIEPDRAQVYRLVGEKILDALQRDH
jgi:predicted esterase